MKTLDGPLERYGKSISEIHKDMSDGHREGPLRWDLQKKVILILERTHLCLNGGLRRKLFHRCTKKSSFRINGSCLDIHTRFWDSDLVDVGQPPWKVAKPRESVNVTT